MVLMAGSSTSPSLLDSRRIELSDPSQPEARQPYHAGFGTARDAGPQLSELVSAIERFGGQSMDAAFDSCVSKGFRLDGVAVVVGSLIDPDSIGNSHVRIHALEGRLFRSIVLQAAERIGLTCAIHRERDLYEEATQRLGKSDFDLRQSLMTIGESTAGSWRAEHKAAALAAWMLLPAP
jgi:hypothetical protein